MIVAFAPAGNHSPAGAFLKGAIMYIKGTAIRWFVVYSYKDDEELGCEAELVSDLELINLLSNNSLVVEKIVRCIEG